MAGKKREPKPGFSFPGPEPEEALRYFREKGLKPAFEFRDVGPEEHAHAFTVAKAMELDLLADVKAEVSRYLADGRTLEQFRRDIEPLLRKRGWWDRKKVVDQRTGKEREVQLGSPWRLRVIYRSNLRAARAAGQWERIQRTRKTHPYLRYALGSSREHREEHVAWAGTLLPVEDDWWHDHFPPNGWG